MPRNGETKEEWALKCDRALTDLLNPPISGPRMMSIPLGDARDIACALLGSLDGDTVRQLAKRLAALIAVLDRPDWEMSPQPTTHPVREKQRKMTTEQRSDIIARFSRGETNRVIATETGWNINTVKKMRAASRKVAADVSTR